MSKIDEEFRKELGAVLSKHKPRSILIAYSFAQPVNETTDELNEGVLVDGDLENLARTMHMALQRSPKLLMVIGWILKARRV